jgi:hypothetical protein
MWILVRGERAHTEQNKQFIPQLWPSWSSTISKTRPIFTFTARLSHSVDYILGQSLRFCAVCLVSSFIATGNVPSEQARDVCAAMIDIHSYPAPRSNLIERSLSSLSINYRRWSITPPIMMAPKFREPCGPHRKEREKDYLPSSSAIERWEDRESISERWRPGGPAGHVDPLPATVDSVVTHSDWEGP